MVTARRAQGTSTSGFSVSPSSGLMKRPCPLISIVRSPSAASACPGGHKAGTTISARLHQLDGDSRPNTGAENTTIGSTFPTSTFPGPSKACHQLTFSALRRCRSRYHPRMLNCRARGLVRQTSVQGLSTHCTTRPSCRASSGVRWTTWRDSLTRKNPKVSTTKARLSAMSTTLMALSASGSSCMPPPVSSSVKPHST